MDFLKLVLALGAGLAAAAICSLVGEKLIGGLPNNAFGETAFVILALVLIGISGAAFWLALRALDWVDSRGH